MNSQLDVLENSIDERRDAIAARLRVQYVKAGSVTSKAYWLRRHMGTFSGVFEYLSAVSQREFRSWGNIEVTPSGLRRVEREREDARRRILAYKASTEQKLSDSGVEKGQAGLPCQDHP